MSKSFVSTLCACLTALIFGCATSKPASPNLKGPFTVKKYSNAKPGSIEAQIDLSKSNQLEKDFKGWLSKPRSMKSSWTNYVPNLVVESDLTMVNFVGRTVVLSTRQATKATWDQYTWKDDGSAQKLGNRLLEFVSAQVNEDAEMGKKR